MIQFTRKEEEPDYGAILEAWGIINRLVAGYWDDDSNSLQIPYKFNEFMTRAAGHLEDQLYESLVMVVPVTNFPSTGTCRRCHGQGDLYRDGYCYYCYGKTAKEAPMPMPEDPQIGDKECDRGPKKHCINCKYLSNDKGTLKCRVHYQPLKTIVGDLHHGCWQFKAVREK